MNHAPDAGSNEMNFGMNHAPVAGSIAPPVDLQSSVLPIMLRLPPMAIMRKQCSVV